MVDPLKSFIEGLKPDIIRPALHVTRWGVYGGRERKPCIEDPMLLKGQPIGMYHCPGCGMMLLAGVAHLSPSAPSPEQQDPLYPLDDYEVEYGRDWPDGYYSKRMTWLRRVLRLASI